MADRAIRVALSLAPDNRFILRSAARFYLHNDEPDKAHAVIVGSGATENDPWLLSTELAIASAIKRSSRFVSQARRVAENGSFRLYDRSELAVAIASLEFEASGGSQKRIRKFFKQALADPTENTLAQAEWLVKKATGLDVVQPSTFETPGKFEAIANEQFRNGNWRDAYKSTILWMMDQPFSVRPAILATFLGTSLVEDLDEAIRIGEESRKANPADATLLNNLAFAYANAGKLNDAVRILRQANKYAKESYELVTVTATSGLIAFRQGDSVLGEEAYRAAIDIAKNDKGQRRFEHMSIAYLEREKMIADHTKAAESLKVMDETLRKSNDRLTQAVIQKIIDETKKRAEAPVN